MTAEELRQKAFDALVCGYHRGLVGAPLCVDDIGLTRGQLIEKYRRHLEGQMPLAKASSTSEPRT